MLNVGKRWIAPALMLTVACGQDSGDRREMPTATGPDGGIVSLAHDLGSGARPIFGGISSGTVGASAVGDVQNGPIEILRVRVRPTGAPGFYAEPNRTYQVNPFTPVEFWVEYASSTTLATPPRLVIEWGTGETDNIHCGPCRLNRTFGEGRYTVRVRMDDRVGGVTTRTFVIDATPIPTGPVCTELTMGTLVNGTINGGGTLQNGRIFRDGVPSVCPTKAYPGIFNVGTMYGFTVHSFSAPDGAPVCLTVNFDPNSGASPCGTNGHMSAYAGAYDPGNQATNYVGDVGSSVTQPFSFQVNGGAMFSLVVTNTAAAATCDYQFSFTTSVCQ